MDDNQIEILCGLYQQTLRHRTFAQSTEILDRLLVSMNDAARDVLRSIDLIKISKPSSTARKSNINFLYQSSNDATTRPFSDESPLVKMTSLHGKDSPMMDRTQLDQSFYRQDQELLKWQNKAKKEELKKNATNKIKGRLLCVLSKNTGSQVRSSFLRWYVRTHRKFGKYVIRDLAVKNKISVQVAFWRFKKIAQPLKDKMKIYTLILNKVSDAIINIEEKSKNNRLRDCFWKMKQVSRVKQVIQTSSVLYALADLIDSQLNVNLVKLKNDTEVFSNKDIFAKLAKAFMGKYLLCFESLKRHNFNQKFEENLSNETKKRLLERLCKGSMGNFQGIKHQGLEKLKSNLRKFYRKRALCLKLCDINFRLMAQGYKKMINEHREHNEMIKNKVKFVIKSLSDRDAMFLGMAYRTLKERWNM